MAKRAKPTTPQEAHAQNVSVFMEDGPRLSTRYSIYVVARDRARRRVRLGGLGALGIGQMWFDEGPEMERYVGFADAPELAEEA